MAGSITVVLDASAYLALIKGEPGWQRVAEALPSAALTSVNAAEIYAKLLEWVVDAPTLLKHRSIIDERIVPFDADLALRSARLRLPTRSLGLSLGDRACLALAERQAVPALTADRNWAKLNSGIGIEVIR